MLPRGIRNNNPLNIRIGNRWEGESPHPTDTEFEQFVSMEYGVRAAFILLRRYIKRYHLRTIWDIISRWAPSTENNTNKYARFVSEKMGISVCDVLDCTNRFQMVNLVCAMAQYENGQQIDRELVERVYMRLVWGDKDV